MHADLLFPGLALARDDNLGISQCFPDSGQSRFPWKRPSFQPFRKFFAACLAPEQKGNITTKQNGAGTWRDWQREWVLGWQTGRRKRPVSAAPAGNHIVSTAWAWIRTGPG